MSIVIGHTKQQTRGTGKRNLKKENCLDDRLVPTVPNNFAREHFPEGTSTTVRRSDCYTSKRFRRWTEAQWSANGWGNNII